MGLKDPIHIIDAIKTYGKKTALVFGKGPSFNPSAKDLYPHSLIITINESCNFVKSDVCIFNDHPVVSMFTENAISGSTFFCAPIGFKTFHDVVFSFHDAVKMSRNLEKMSYKMTYFDCVHTSYKKFFNYPRIHSSMSTYESLLWILFYSGIKTIRTSGIDHTVEHSKYFHEREIKTPFAATRYYEKMMAESLEIDIQPAPKEI